MYDTSGPFTDSNAQIDLLKGLMPLRALWTEERKDTEELLDLTSEPIGLEGRVELQTAVAAIVEARVVLVAAAEEHEEVA